MAAHFGMIGLGTMGSNFVLNVTDHGFEASGYDRDVKQQQKLKDETKGRKVTVAASLQEFIKVLETPRIIMLLVPAGKIVDAVIADLLPLVQKGDILIDGGNSHFIDTQKRYEDLKGSGIHFVGMGVSGGEEGARYGPSLMPGGNPESYERIKRVFEAVAAKTEQGPCVSFIGNGAAGHYTKMVHNGIEYAMMQLISEVYDILKLAGGLTNDELHDVFKEWNQFELQSFLVEITADIFLKKDDDTPNDLVDMVLDKAKQKGTGMWTSQSAMDLGVPLTIVDAAVSMRYLSSSKAMREKNAKFYQLAGNSNRVNKKELITLCRNALHFSFLLSYAQGLDLLSVASERYNYGINIAEVLRVWKGGCIIRSASLNDLRSAFLQDKSLSNIVSSDLFRETLGKSYQDVTQLLGIAMARHIPTPSLSAALNYFYALVTARLPANLIQSQRDYFGAHTYERTDKPGIFHSQWENKPPVAVSAQKPKED